MPETTEDDTIQYQKTFLFDCVTELHNSAVKEKYAWKVLK